MKNENIKQKNISPRIVQLNKFKNKKDFGIALEVFFLP